MFLIDAADFPSVSRTYEHTCLLPGAKQGLTMVMPIVIESLWDLIRSYLQ